MKVIFCGDVSVCDSRELFAKQDVEGLFHDVPEVLQTADKVVVNLECAVTDKKTAIKKCGPNLNAPFGTVECLKRVGVTECALSNNHIFDFGRAGLADTLAELDKNGIPYTGIGENVKDARRDMIFEQNGKKIAIINVCEHEYTYALEDRAGAREFDPFETADDIAEAKKHADFVVLIYHGGKEMCRYPSPRLLKLCRSMVRRGADLVMCQHTHCIGCYEQFEGGHILYGQGNFHFVWDEMYRRFDCWNEGLIVKATFEDTCKVELIPTVVDGLGIRLAKGEEKEKILAAIAERSRSLADGSYKKGWEAFCQTVPQYRVFEKYFSADEREIFAHYLDCEAHYDVWKELYKTYNHTNERD